MTFRLQSRDLSYWSVRQHRWVLEGGTFRLGVGVKAEDIARKVDGVRSVDNRLVITG